MRKAFMAAGFTIFSFLSVTAGELPDHGRKLPVLPGLAHAWSFSENAEGKIVDSVDTPERPGIALTVAGKPEFVDGLFGPAAKLSRPGDFFTFPKELTAEFTDRYALVMVVRFDDRSDVPLFATGKDHVRFYRVIPFPGGEDKIGVFASVAGVAKQQGEAVDARLGVGEWNSIVVNGFRKGAHMYADVFVNGVKVMDQGYVRSPGSVAGGDVRYGVIGGEGGRNPKSLPATFDEIQIYGRSLNDREVAGIHASLTEE